MVGQTSVTRQHWELANLGWLGERSARFRQEVSTHVLLRRYSSGDYPHHVGDDAGGIYGVIEGSFGTYAVSDAAGIVLGHIFREGAWFGQGPITSGKPRYLSFKAMEPSVILYLPPAALNQIAQSFPGAERELMSLSEYNQVLMTRVVSDLLIRKTECRIAAVLLRLFEIRPGGLRGGDRCRLTQAELSEMANTSRHTANTVLKSFEQKGWIEVSYGSITLINPEELRRYAYA
nr:Crp/Fnr family transcriptional regulator [Salipiger mangrovisoli]